jgi:hypothetical protein
MKQLYEQSLVLATHSNVYPSGFSSRVTGFSIMTNFVKTTSQFDAKADLGQRLVA